MEQSIQQKTSIKQQWPELEGKNGEDAKAIILNENENLKVFIIPAGSVVTMDVDFNRVRIYVDEDGYVSGIPKRG